MLTSLENKGQTEKSRQRSGAAGLPSTPDISNVGTAVQCQKADITRIDSNNSSARPDREQRDEDIDIRRNKLRYEVLGADRSSLPPSETENQCSCPQGSRIQEPRSESVYLLSARSCGGRLSPEIRCGGLCLLAAPRAASGHATAQPSSPMNSRRLTWSMGSPTGTRRASATAALGCPRRTCRSLG